MQCDAEVAREDARSIAFVKRKGDLAMGKHSELVSTALAAAALAAAILLGPWALRVLSGFEEGSAPGLAPATARQACNAPGSASALPGCSTSGEDALRPNAAGQRL
jgi:hypothetical protein